MRLDLETVIDQAPSTVRKPLLMRRHVKLFGHIESTICAEEKITALVAIMPPEATAAVGGNAGSLRNLGGQLLLVTNDALYAFYGKLVGRPEFVKIPLASVYAEPRLHSKRELLSLGHKVHKLAIDEQRAGDVETHFFIVDGDEESLQWISDQIVKQVNLHRQRVEDHKMRRTQDAVRAEVSVADELTKLADLRDKGVLSDKEFAQQKERLLGSPGQ
jgi:hypothetical protein